MHQESLARRARAAMLASIGEIVEKADTRLRRAGLSELDEDEISTLYLAIAEGREPQKALNDLTRDRRWDPSTRASHACFVALPEGEGDPGYDDLVAEDREGFVRDPSLQDSSRLELVRALLRISEILSVDEMRAAADALNQSGAWKARRTIDGRAVGRKYATSAFRISGQRAPLASALAGLPSIVQAMDADGLVATTEAVLREARALSVYYGDWFGADLGDVLSRASSLLESAASELRTLAGATSGAPQAADQAGPWLPVEIGVCAEVEAEVGVRTGEELAQAMRARPGREARWKAADRRGDRGQGRIPGVGWRPRRSVRARAKDAGPSLEPGPAMLDDLGTNPIASSNHQSFFDRKKDCSAILRWAG